MVILTPSIALAAALGAVIGVFSGLLGIGGGSMMLPVLRLGFGLSPLAATASSLFAILPISLFGGLVRVRAKTALPLLGLCLGLGGALTSPIGVKLAQFASPLLIMAVASLVIIWSAVKMFRRSLRSGKAQETGREGQAGKRRGGKSSSEKGEDAAFASCGVSQGKADSDCGDQQVAFWKISSEKAIKALLIGAVAGLVAGFVGLGGGFLMVPLMISALKVDVRHATGTSLVAISLLALPGSIEQCLLGNVAYGLSVAMALGSIPGSLLGARLAKTIDDRAVCLFFSVFLLLAALMLVGNELMVLLH